MKAPCAIASAGYYSFSPRRHSVSRMIQIFPSTRFWRVITVLWIAICVSLLVWTILLRNGPHRPFWDANEAESLLMMNLAFPSSMTVYCKPIAGVVVRQYTEVGNDLRSILFVWLYLFVVGYLQWFVLVPLIARWVERK
jgi:hypothetical protein